MGGADSRQRTDAEPELKRQAGTQEVRDASLSRALRCAFRTLQGSFMVAQEHQASSVRKAGCPTGVENSHLAGRSKGVVLGYHTVPWDLHNGIQEVVGQLTLSVDGSRLVLNTVVSAVQFRGEGIRPAGPPGPAAARKFVSFHNQYIKSISLTNKHHLPDKRQWFSGKIHRCHRWAPRSIRGWRKSNLSFFLFFS